MNYRNRQKTPAAVGAILERTLKGLRIEKKLKQYEWFSRWPEFVGEDIAKVSYPEKILRGSLLVVKVVDITWAQELSLKKQEILDTIYNQNLGINIQDIWFVSGSPKEFSKKLARKDD